MGRMIFLKFCFFLLSWLLLHEGGNGNTSKKNSCAVVWVVDDPSTRFLFTMEPQQESHLVCSLLDRNMQPIKYALGYRDCFQHVAQAP